jgi:hypothetical protein
MQDASGERSAGHRVTADITGEGVSVRRTSSLMGAGNDDGMNEAEAIGEVSYAAVW